MTASTAGSSATVPSARAKSSAEAAAIRSTGLPTAASGGQARAQRARGVGVAQRLDAQAGGRARVGAEDARAAGVGEDRDAVAARGAAGAASSAATSKSSPSVSARMTPAWRKSASTVTSEAASSAPVCEPAARAPAAERPDLTARIGLRARDPRGRSGRSGAGSRTTRGRAGSRRCPGPAPSSAGGRCPRGRPCCPSTRTTTARGRGARPRSMTAIPSAPLWDTKPIRPGRRRGRGEGRVQPTSGAVLRTPRQLGPTSRMPGGAADASSSRWRRAPSAPASAKPAESTTSARTPLRRALARDVEHGPRGTAMTARSTGPGDVEHRAVQRPAGERAAAPVDEVQRRRRSRPSRRLRRRSPRRSCRGGPTRR